MKTLPNLGFGTLQRIYEAAGKTFDEARLRAAAKNYFEAKYGIGQIREKSLERIYAEEFGAKNPPRVWFRKSPADAEETAPIGYVAHASGGNLYVLPDGTYRTIR